MYSFICQPPRSRRFGGSHHLTGCPAPRRVRICASGDLLPCPSQVEERASARSSGERRLHGSGARETRLSPRGRVVRAGGRTAKRALPGLAWACSEPGCFPRWPRRSGVISRFCGSLGTKPQGGGGRKPARPVRRPRMEPSWGVPLAITVAAVALKKIGYDASDVSVGWCWINLEAEDRVLWMLLTGKLWELLAYVTLPVLYLLIRKHIHRAHEELSEYRPILSEAHQLQRRTSVANKKLVLIPLIFICLRVWSTVRFVLTLCGSPAVRMPVLVVLHGIGNTFQGGANCIMFVFCTRVVRTRLLSLCCCCCSPQPPEAPAPSKRGESQRPRRTPNELPST